MRAEDELGTREPEAEFVYWLDRFGRSIGAALRCRFNPQRKRWVVDERNRENGLWQCILVWETDDGKYLDLNRELALRLELNAWKYNQMIISPKDYLLDLQRRADNQLGEINRSAEDETVYAMKQDKAGIRKIMDGFLLHEHLKEKAQWRRHNKGKTIHGRF